MNPLLRFVQGLDQQAALQVGLGAGWKFWCQSQVTGEADIELETLAILGFENAGQEDYFVQRDRVTLQLVYWFCH